MLDHYIVILQIRFVDGLILWFRIFFGQENLYRHKGAVFLQYFSDTVLIGKLQAVIIQIQGHRGSHFCLGSFVHLIVCAALAYPVYRLCALFIGKGIDMHFISNHERRIESQSKVADHIVFCSFVFIFLQKFGGSGKCDLCNVFLHLFCRHTDTVIGKFQCLLFWIYFHLNGWLIPVRKLVLPHHIQFFQLRDGVTSIGYHFTHENIMV